MNMEVISWLEGMAWTSSSSKRHNCDAIDELLVASSFEKCWVKSYPCSKPFGDSVFTNLWDEACSKYHLSLTLSAIPLGMQVDIMPFYRECIFGIADQNVI